MAYFVTILTPDSAWSCVMQCTLPTEGMRSIISMVSISLEGFLPSILLLVMIIVAVVIVAVILVVVVVAIVGVVIVVMIIGVFVIVMIIRVVVVVVVGVSFILKLSFMIISFLHRIALYPLMKASISFSEFGTMFGHKTANSWNLLTPGDPISLFYSDRLGVCIPPGQGIVVRITKQGYYWPSMHREAAKAIQDCDKCKEQSAIRKAGADGAIAVKSTWPFSHWGIHILGPLPMALGGL
ncbi:hypothetical protein Tco_0972574 [Tanacetum coccineum]